MAKSDAAATVTNCCCSNGAFYFKVLFKFKVVFVLS